MEKWKTEVSIEMFLTGTESKFAIRKFVIRIEIRSLTSAGISCTQNVFFFLGLHRTNSEKYSKSHDFV